MYYRREEYIENWWKLVDWEEVERLDKWWVNPDSINKQKPDIHMEQAPREGHYSKERREREEAEGAGDPVPPSPGAETGDSGENHPDEAATDEVAGEDEAAAAGSDTETVEQAEPLSQPERERPADDNHNEL